MKRISLILFVALSSSIFSLCQAQTWQWGKSAGGSEDDAGNSIASDRVGNAYATGYFSSASMAFGNITLSNISATSQLFVAKYNAAGNVVWAKTATGANTMGLGITIDDSCNIYVTGEFSGPEIIFGKDTLLNAGLSKMFLVKYDSAGNVKWAQTDSINTDCSGNCIKADHNGHVYVTGEFSYQQEIAFQNIVLTNPGSGTIFIVKYNTNGKALWATCNSGDNSSVTGIDADASENVYITGTYSNPTIIFGKDTLVNPNSIYNNIYIVKYDSSGNVRWARNSTGNTSADYGFGVAVFNPENIYIVGGFQSSTISFGNFKLTNAGSENIFVVKYDSGGNVQWATSSGGSGPDAAQGICLDSHGNIFTTGIFWSPSITFGNSVINNDGRADIYVAEYDPSGNALWGIAAGGSQGDYGNAISNNANGDSYITGDFYSTNLSFGNSMVSSNGGLDMCVAKLSTPLGIADIKEPASINVFPNPSNGVFTLSCHSEQSEESNPMIEVYNVLGEQVLTETLRFAQGDNIINLSSQPSGVYLYRVLAGSGELVGEGRLVIQK